MEQSAANGHREVVRLMQAREWHAAQSACRRLTARHPSFAPAWFAASRIALAMRLPREALEAADRAVEIEPANLGFLLLRGQCLMALGRRAEVLAATDAAAPLAGSDPRAWDAIGTLRSYAADQPGALGAYDRAVALAPQNPALLFNRASVRRFVGDFEGAEADYDRAIALQPTDYEAYLNRSHLRVQTAARNHVAELERLIREARLEPRAEVELRFALAKEHEDLGHYAISFEHLHRGAALRRQRMSYEVAIDVATVGWIMSAFPCAPTEALAAASPEDPIFIVGLPRSGSTVVERILASHSALSSAGELDCFARALVDAAERKSGGAHLPRERLVGLSATLDFAALGGDYLGRARAASGVAGRFIDKMPLNYLYCGLIRRALPRAKIIHVTRNPMAQGYAMYKTLFKDGYPFSYDLGEIAQYYLAYRRLMQHWPTTMPGSIHEVSYESLIADQRAETRKLLEYCGLEWEDACVEFHRNPRATTTASASQVRRPLYASSVSQWRHYEVQLTELRNGLAAGGILE